jgi:hypothetical protein
LKALARLLSPALRGVRANLVPGLVLQCFALAIVLGYFGVAAIGTALDVVGAIKERLGYLYSSLATALFGGVIPFCVLLASGKVARGRAGRELLFYVTFWAWKGAEVDALYRAQALWFGHEASAVVMVQKTLVDQFVYNPLWAAPTQTIFFLWKDSGFSFGQLEARLAQQSLKTRVLVVLLSTWVVWIPAVGIIYSLPSALQLPLFNLVLCFWCLLLSFVSRDPAPGV